MKRLISVLLIAGTLLTAGFGFFLPGFLSRIQDASLQNRVNISETSGITFHPAASLEDSLMLLADGVAMELPQDAHTRLNADGALLAAEDVSQKLYLPPADCYSDRLASSRLAVSGDRLKSAIVWKCVFSGQNCRLTMFLDDRSGKMLAFQLIDTGISFPQTYDVLLMEKLFFPCAAYYGGEQIAFLPDCTPAKQSVESEAGKDVSSRQAEGTAEKYDFRFTGTVTWKNSAGRETRIPAGLTEYSFFFGSAALFE